MYGSKPYSGGGDESIPLYDPDDFEVLREELLEAYTTPREKLHTRDEEAAIKRNENVYKKAHIQTIKEKKDETTILKLKAKQDALRRLYEHVISDKEKKQKRESKISSDYSSGSFHKMYAVYHDPKGDTKFIRGEEQSAEGDMRMESSKDEKETTEVTEATAMKIVDAPEPSKPPPPKPKPKPEPASAKERSKFVLKQSPLKPKPPPLLDDRKVRNSREMRHRKDTRYSEDRDRYSFDVDVLGPFLHFTDSRKPAPKMRTIATQAMLVDADKMGSEQGSQTEFDIVSYRGDSSKRTSKASDAGSFRKDEFDDNDSSEGGGDASYSSSNQSEKDEDEVVEEKASREKSKGKKLERKESKRREAETMARPRGYRNLDLKDKMAYVSFEAETYVTPHDLEREEAKQRGYTLLRDNVLWPTYSQFDMDTAAKKIEEYIKRCWTLDPKWLFVIQPLEVYHDNYRKKYVFEVKFSVPSPTTPVPPATASVFFVFEIPIYSMKDETVKVSYVLEGTRFAHQPGKIPFQDKWLWGIISDKLRVQKAVNF